MGDIRRRASESDLGRSRSRNLSVPEDIGTLRKSKTLTKFKKENRHEGAKAKSDKAKSKVNFGICFDIDGVLARGTVALPTTRKAFSMLTDNKGAFRIPTVFVSNSLNKNADKAAQISGWTGVEILPSQMIQCQGPLELFTEYHHKFCLILGQGKIEEIASELGFTNFCVIDEIAEAYPLLDVVDHDNRKRNAERIVIEKDFPRIEAIVMLGEPKRWDQALQLLIDLLVTDGKPDKAPDNYPEVHLPVLACNMDLEFMDLACIPRFGHGAFLACLECLYKKVTGHKLEYTAMIGKPSEITFRFAEHCLAREAKRLGINNHLKRMYLVGDTPEVDIVGSNLYQRFIDRLTRRRSSHEVLGLDINLNVSLNMYPENEEVDPELPECRNIPLDSALSPQTVKEICGVLVCTGVYKPGRDNLETMGEDKRFKGHRDFPVSSALYRPTKVVDNVEKAVEYIFKRENTLLSG